MSKELVNCQCSRALIQSGGGGGVCVCVCGWGGQFCTANNMLETAHQGIVPARSLWSQYLLYL